MTSDALYWSAIVGFFLPPVLSVIQQPRWPSWVRAVVGFIAAIIVSLGALYFAGTLVFTGAEAKPIITLILLVLVTSITTYKGFWHPTGISPAIEGATSSSTNTPPSVPGSVVTVHVDGKPVITVPAADPPSTPPAAPAG